MVRPVRTPPCPLERSVPRCSPLCASRQGVDTTLASRAGPPSAQVAHRSVSSTARPSPQPCAASPGSRRGEMPTCIAWSRVGATTRGRSTTGTTTARRCVRGVPAMRPSGSHEAVRRQVRQTLAQGRHGVRAPARGGGGGEQRGGHTTVRVHASSSPSSSGGPPPDRPSGERSLSQTAAVLLLTVLAMVLSTANRALPSPSRALARHAHCERIAVPLRVPAGASLGHVVVDSNRTGPKRHQAPRQGDPVSTPPGGEPLP